MLISRGFELLNKLVDEVPEELNDIVRDYINGVPIIIGTKPTPIFNPGFLKIFEIVENFNLRSVEDYLNRIDYIEELPTKIEDLITEHRISLEVGDDNDLKRLHLTLFTIAMNAKFENKTAVEVLTEKIDNFYDKKYTLKSISRKIIGKTNNYYSVHCDKCLVGIIALLLDKPINVILEQLANKVKEGEI